MLNGTIIGDVGFDPMGLSSQLELNYIRASEIKHGRVAMLATVGYLVQQYVQLPLYHEANPIKAWSSVPVAANVQIILFCGIFELATLTSTVRGGEPGAYGYDPLGFSKGKTKEQMDDLKLKELKNGRSLRMPLCACSHLRGIISGRLAMFAIFGMVAQSFLFDKPTLSF
jgi:hypothetical protein